MAHPATPQGLYAAAKAVAAKARRVPPPTTPEARHALADSAAMVGHDKAHRIDTATGAMRHAMQCHRAAVYAADDAATAAGHAAAAVLAMARAVAEAAE